MTEHDVAIGGHRIHYVEWKGDGRSVVCVHGLTANCRYFDSLGERLAPEYRVIAYDRRGCGDSSEASTGRNVVRHAADLESLLDVLSIERAILVGHSLGAAISAFFAAHFPERVDRLVLVDGGGGGPLLDYDALLENIRPMVERLGVKHASLEAYLGSVKAAYGDRNWTRYARNVYVHDARTNADGSVGSKISPETAIRDFRALKNYDALNAFSRIRCPTLFLRATDGYQGRPPIVSREAAQHMARAIQGCKVVELNGTNHATILLAESDDTSRAIKAFLGT